MDIHHDRPTSSAVGHPAPRRVDVQVQTVLRGLRRSSQRQEITTAIASRRKKNPSGNTEETSSQLFNKENRDAFLCEPPMTLKSSLVWVSSGSPTRGGDVATHIFDINQPSLPILLYFVLVSVSVFMALSTVFDSINSPDNSPLSHSVVLVLSLPYQSFQLLISL